MDYLGGVIGNNLIEDFDGRRLPSIQEVMSVYLYHKKNLRAQRRECLLITINKVKEKWSQAGITTCGTEYAIKKLSGLLDQVKNLQKSSNRRWSKTQKQKKSNFGHKLKNLFDCSIQCRKIYQWRSKIIFGRPKIKKSIRINR